MPLPNEQLLLEIKPTSSDAWLTADGEQVSRYWGKYRQVLVTNYRDFVFIGEDAAAKPVKFAKSTLHAQSSLPAMG